MAYGEYQDGIQCPHCDHKYNRVDSLTMMADVKNGCFKKVTCSICGADIKVLRSVSVVFSSDKVNADKT